MYMGIWDNSPYESCRLEIPFAIWDNWETSLWKSSYQNHSSAETLTSNIQLTQLQKKNSYNKLALEPEEN
jgi:hypothetical protein